ncbi:MAG: TIGR01777 family oxidoreductase [Verrucomicrobiae bacterium]|nr:TIGR01777 family oxidoreductase [Verrucomicrobiae bacterium]
MENFRKTTRIEVSAAELERWHFRPGAFQRLTPPWENVEVVEEPGEITDGARAVIKTKIIGPISTQWIAEHKDCIAGNGFTDIQIKGPFAYWKHVHTFKDADENSCTLDDSIDYRLPMGFLGKMFGGGFVRTKLERTFRYRHALTKMDLERQASEPGTITKPMTVLVTGATGMVGSALEGYLKMRGHRVRRVTRRPTRPDDVRWDSGKGEFDLPKDAVIDAVVHLAGENVAGGRWSAARRQRILGSRREGTRLLCETIAKLDRPPSVLVSASGVNYYETGTEMPVDESEPRGSGFLSDVCEVWESNTSAAEAAGIRTVHLRLGVILSPAGGALAKMLPAFQFGVAGRLGTGTQRIAWISLDDVIDIIHRATLDERFTEAINAVAPDIVTNSEFTETLADILHRPAILPVPALALQLALGEQMANETLLADLAIAPGKLEQLGYPFRFPRLDSALAYMLGRST